MLRVFRWPPHVIPTRLELDFHQIGGWGQTPGGTKKAPVAEPDFTPRRYSKFVCLCSTLRCVSSVVVRPGWCKGRSTQALPPHPHFSPCTLGRSPFLSYIYIYKNIYILDTSNVLTPPPPTTATTETR